jgi:hypothetical protein
MAAPQIFAEVLGSNLAVPRRPISDPSRPVPIPLSELEGRVGSRVLPEWMDVVDDPTQTEWRGRPLAGHYRIDVEGVIPQPVNLVEKGILKSYLLTRQPVKGTQGTNGHARLPGNFGSKTAVFSNLFVRAAETVPATELKKKLLEMIQQRNKPYGVIIRKQDYPSAASLEELRRIATAAAQRGGGGRVVSPPVLIYRVYPDGKEELVRGLRYRGLGARAFKDIVAASEDVHVFDFLNNTAPMAMRGAAGYVAPCSVAAPSVLFDEVELERPEEELPKPPIVPPPPRTGS